MRENWFKLPFHIRAGKSNMMTSLLVVLSLVPILLFLKGADIALTLFHLDFIIQELNT